MFLFGSSNFPKLREINLNHNRLRILEANVFAGGLKSVEVIDLSNNHLLLLLDNTFAAVSHLRELNLRNNSLVYIGKKFVLFSFYQLVYPDLLNVHPQFKNSIGHEL